MAIVIDMPKLSDTMTVGTLVNWLVKEGDTVASGDMIAEVETDKATMELENFEDGVILKQYVSVGDQVAIGAPIAAIGEAGEAAPEVAAAPAPEVKEEAVAKAPEVPKPVAAQAPTPVTPVKAQQPSVVDVTEVPAVAPVSNGAAGGVKASPLAKKLAAERGVSLDQVKGTGPGGRITKVDVMSFVPGAQSVPASQSTPSVETPASVLRDEVIPVTNMRRAIAQHLLTSKTTVPHFYLNTTANVKGLIELRKSLNDQLSGLVPEHGGIKLTVNDFVMKATALAIQRVPGINSSWSGDSVYQYANIDISFGVAIDEGLVTPVIRQSQNKSLKQMSLEAKALVKKARAKKLQPEEMTNSTFTVTNLGMFGIESFYGIINAPNAGILSVGSAYKEPVFDKNDEVTVGYKMNLGFSGDHRVIDGATGAQFLTVLKEILETPEVILV